MNLAGISDARPASTLLTLRSGSRHLSHAAAALPDIAIIAIITNASMLRQKHLIVSPLIAVHQPDAACAVLLAQGSTALQHVGDSANSEAGDSGSSDEAGAVSPASVVALKMAALACKPGNGVSSSELMYSSITSSSQLLTLLSSLGVVSSEQSGAVSTAFARRVPLPRPEPLPPPRPPLPLAA